MFLSTILGLSLFFLGCFGASQKRYDGFQVLKTAIPNEVQHRALNSLLDQDLFDFWTLPSLSTPAEIMSSPQKLNLLTDFLKEIDLDFSIKIDDVQRLIEDSQKGQKQAKNESAPYELTWDEYYKSHVIHEYLEYLAENYDFVRTEKIAETFEGRDVLSFQILKAGENKKNVFIETSAHGREWIGPAVVTFMIRELVENHEANAKYTDNLNFHMVPMFNPDGYDYSFVGERLWRKSRTKTYNDSCVGVDLNRNFPFEFGGPSTSSDPCNEFFKGSEAFSEPESNAVGKFFSSIKPVPELAISYHSAFDAFLYPYGHDAEVFPDNKEEMIELCEDAIEALNEVDGQSFYCMKGTSLYPVGGCGMDWFISEGSRFSYTPELRDNGYGFVLPPEFILPSGKENWAALKVMMDKILE